MEVNAFLRRIREPINFLTQVGQLVCRHQTKVAIRYFGLGTGGKKPAQAARFSAICL
ncbi:MAG: hypothetical protein ACLT4C_00280 [Butyricicoccus sp.]